MMSRASGSVSSTPRSAAAARYHFDKQLRKNPAVFMTSRFWTSVRPRKCSTRRRNAAASISVRVGSGMSVAMTTLSMCYRGGVVTKVEHAGTTFHLVGTAHVSRRSIEEVRAVVDEVRPDVVCVQLD